MDFGTDTENKGNSKSSPSQLQNFKNVKRIMDPSLQGTFSGQNCNGLPHVFILIHFMKKINNNFIAKIGSMTNSIITYKFPSQCNSAAGNLERS